MLKLRDLATRLSLRLVKVRAMVTARLDIKRYLQGCTIGGSAMSILAAALGLSAVSGLANSYMQYQTLQYNKDLQSDIFARR